MTLHKAVVKIANSFRLTDEIVSIVGYIRIENSLKFHTKKKKQSLNPEFSGVDFKVNHVLIFTRYSRALFKAAKQFKVENNYKHLWFKNSQFLLRKVDNGEVIVIRSFDDIAQIHN